MSKVRENDDTTSTATGNENPAALPDSLSETRKRPRFAELDFIRGVCVILMIFDHFMCDVWTFFPKGAFGVFAKEYWVSDFRIFWHWVVVTLFFVICGISCSLSRSNFKRGLYCFGAACFLTWGTYLLESTSLGKGFFIFFGVLHCIGLSILVFAGLDFVAKKAEKHCRKLAEKKNSDALGKAARALRALPALVGVVLAIVYFTCIFEEARGEFLIGKQYGGALGFLPSVFGFEPAADSGFYSADFFPLLPYVSILLVGSLLGEFVYKNRRRSLIPALERKAAAPVNFIGRHALIFYVGHQIVLGGIFALVYFMI